MTRFALLALLLLAACAPPPEPSGVPLTQLALRLAPGDTPPPPDAGGWQPRTLPDRWSRAEREQSLQGWYRARFALEETPRELWAVYLPEVRMNAAVYVNGEFLGDGGRFREPVARNWNRPLYFPVPAGLLAAGSNRVEVRLAVSPSSQARLRAIHVGPDSRLRAAYERQYLFQITIRQLTIGLILGTALVISFVAIRRPEARSDLWFAAMLLLVAFAQSDGLVRDIPMSTQQWQWANTTAYLLSVVCLVTGVHRVLRTPRPRVELAFGAGAVALSLAVSVVDAPYVPALATAVLFATMTAVVYVIVVFARHRPARHVTSSLTFGLTLTAIGIHDLQALYTGWSLTDVRLVGFLPVAVGIFAGWLLVENLVDALDRSEQLNVELDQRVDEKTLELKQSYDRMRGLVRERALAEERERIMREMHDGVGGLLVGTLAMVEGGDAEPTELADALHEALDEMRLMLDSLDPAEDDLLAVLGAMRARVEPRLARHGLRIDWQVTTLPNPPDMTPGKVLHVLRIAQEAISNAIRHAKAGAIAVRTGEASLGSRAGIFVEISDDGCGFPDAPSDGVHRGLANMRRRAAEIGGELSIDTRPGATAVRLWLPLSDTRA